MDQQVRYSDLNIAWRPVSFRPTPAAVLAAIDHEPDPVALDSANTGGQSGRYTILACRPLEVFRASPTDADPLEAMRCRLERAHLLRALSDPPPCIFPGGWIGYFAYEAGRFIERLPATTLADINLPVARFALYDSAAVHDQVTGTWTVAATDFRHPGSQPDLRHRLDWWERMIADTSANRPPVDRNAPPAKHDRITHNLSRDRFLRLVTQAREYIAAGDIFQVNLTRRETVPAIEQPLNLYLRLRRANPGAYSAYLAWQEAPHDEPTAILCSSPELFLQVDGPDVITRPIKGTRPRDADPAVDDSLRVELAASAKDRAELAMIVDLERNDLGRVCEFGSVRVIESDSPAAPFELQSHATVHHLVATVAGRLAEGRDVIDLLRATFPGGSITGAPKIRAMQIIDELEPTQRGVYTGCIGYFAPGGRMTMNIAIRTMLQAGGKLHWFAGGGIVADSDPAAEYDETCAKAEGMRRAMGIETAISNPLSAFERK
jgi:para-aminobenzoate synthetase component I